MDSGAAAPPPLASAVEIDHPATPSPFSQNPAAEVCVQLNPYACLPTTVRSSLVQRSQIADQGKREFLECEGKVAKEVADQLDTSSYLEIKNVLWIENSPLHREALKQWERKAYFLALKTERKKRLQESLSIEIYNLVGFYSVFQGVLLIAVVFHNGVSSKRSVPFEFRLCSILLSCLSSLMTIFGLTVKLGQAREIATSIRFDEQDLGDVNVKVQELRRCGHRFQFRDRLYHKPSKLGTSWSNFFTVLAVTVFACLFSLSIWFITNE